MAATSSEAASKAHEASMFFAIIHQYCRKIDRDHQERVRVRNGIAASLEILKKLKEYPEFRREAAECHIEGAMQDPAEPPSSAADAEPAVAPDAEPPLLAELAQADTFWNDEWRDRPEQQSEVTPEAPPGPPSSEHAEPTEWRDRPEHSEAPEAPEAQEDVSWGDWLPTDQFEEHAEPTEFVHADANWDNWPDPDEAEQISEAQSSQLADQHTRHNGEHSAHYWSHNTPTTGTAADAETDDESMPR